MTAQQLAARFTHADANAFLAPDSATARHYAAARELIPGGTSRLHYYYSPYPIYAASANGAVVTDLEGVERLDFLNNMTSLIHGHAHPAIYEAVIAQVQRGVSFSEPAANELDLARIIAERVPSVEQIRFFNSGTESVMMALKLARAYTGRSRIAKFEGHYHGYYDFVQVSFASNEDNWGDPHAPASVPSSGGLPASVTDEVLTLPFNDPDALESLLATHGRTLGALIVDPLTHRSAFSLPEPGFYPLVREMTRAYGIPLIYDEVLSFRIGYHGAQSEYGGAPDLTIFGKIMGGGLPIGAVGGKRELMALLEPKGGKVISGGTMSANPLSMAAGIAAMQSWTPSEVERLNALGRRLRASANAIMADAGIAGRLTGEGSLFSIVLTDAPITNYRDVPYDPATLARIERFHLAMLDRGIIFSHRGLGCLSTAMGDAEVDAFLEAFAGSVGALRDD